ncbi:uncharacterized protein [Ptychodera flava]|uniref:uncharacterized protein n=1 Tax=Ptychodera flava TaxID=63121 RepID=UPI003969CF70
MADNTQENGDAMHLLHGIEAGGLICPKSPVTTDLCPENVDTAETSNEAAVGSGTDVDGMVGGDRTSISSDDSPEMFERPACVKKMREYKCDVCDKIYKSKCGYRKHSRKHTKQYPFNCSCGTGFSEKTETLAYTPNKA